MDTVFIKDCVVEGKHGYYKEEHSKKQKFIVSVYAHIDTKDAGKSDDIRATLNYEHLRNYVKLVLEESPHNLLESLAEEIARRVLEHQVASVEVEITKPEVWNDTTPGVKITRSL